VAIWVSLAAAPLTPITPLPGLPGKDIRLKPVAVLAVGDEDGLIGQQT